MFKFSIALTDSLLTVINFNAGYLFSDTIKLSVKILGIVNTVRLITRVGCFIGQAYGYEGSVYGITLKVFILLIELKFCCILCILSLKLLVATWHPSFSIILANALSSVIFRKYFTPRRVTLPDTKQTS